MSNNNKVIKNIKFNKIKKNPKNIKFAIDFLKETCYNKQRK